VPTLGQVDVQDLARKAVRHAGRLLILERLSERANHTILFRIDTAITSKASVRGSCTTAVGSLIMIVMDGL